MKRRFDALPPAQRAGMLCAEPAFREYVGRRCLGLDWAVSEARAAEFLRALCNIPSRRRLDTDARACQRFEALRTDYDAWRGRIAAPRS